MSVADHRNRETMPSNRCGAGLPIWKRSGSADFEHVADLSLAAWGGLTASFSPFDLPLADMREDGAEVLVLDNSCLRNLPQLVEGGVSQVEPAVADRQPPIGVIDNRDALAGSSRVIVFGSSRKTTLSYCRVKLLETVRSSRQAKTSVRSSPADNRRCRFLGLRGSLPKRAL